MKKSRVFLVIVLTTIFGSFMSLLSQDSQRPSFSRGPGFWSKEADEAKSDFFSQLTAKTSQRENWYTVTPYIAEFWCALSNIGFIYVGIKNKSPELIFAGLASFVSHSVPKQWLNYVDKVGVALIAFKFLRNFDAFLKNPQLLLPVAALGGINLADMYLAHNKASVVPHVLWHLSAAGIMGYLLPKLA